MDRISSLERKANSTLATEAATGCDMFMAPKCSNGYGQDCAVRIGLFEYSWATAEGGEVKSQEKKVQKIWRSMVAAWSLFCQTLLCAYSPCTGTTIVLVEVPRYLESFCYWPTWLVGP